MPGGLHPPLQVFEHWLAISNYTDPPTHGNTAVIVLAILSGITFATVAARLYARAHIQRSFGVDDWLTVAAIVPVIGLVVSCCLESDVFLFNRHVWDVPVSYYIPQRKASLACELFYGIGTPLIKISVLCFYRRLGRGGVSRGFLVIVWASIIFVSGYMVAFTIVLFSACRPFEAFWMQLDIGWITENHPYYCVDEGARLLAPSLISGVQDLLAVFLPMWLLRNVEIPRRQKIALCAVFAVGLLSCACAGIRCYYIYQAFYGTYDITWEAWYCWLWTGAEVLLGMFAASLPALRVYLAHFFHVKSRFPSSSSWIRAKGEWRRATSSGANDTELTNAVSYRSERLATEPKTVTSSYVRNLEDESDEALDSAYFKEMHSSYFSRQQGRPRHESIEADDPEAVISNVEDVLKTSNKSPSRLESGTTKVEKVLGL